MCAFGGFADYLPLLSVSASEIKDYLDIAVTNQYTLLSGWRMRQYYNILLDVIGSIIARLWWSCCHVWESTLCVLLNVMTSLKLIYFNDSQTTNSISLCFINSRRYLTDVYSILVVENPVCFTSSVRITWHLVLLTDVNKQGYLKKRQKQKYVLL